MPTVPQLLPVPLSGYRDGALGDDVFLVLSRNFSLHKDLPVRRPGYTVRRQQALAAFTFLEVIPATEGDGTVHTAFQQSTEIYEDKATPVSRASGLTNPYATKTTKTPRWGYMQGRSIWVDGTTFRVLIWDTASGTLKVLPSIPDPDANAGLSAAAGGSMTVGTWFVRVRFYDSITGTYSGPSSRLLAGRSCRGSEAPQPLQAVRPHPHLQRGGRRCGSRSRCSGNVR